MKKNGFTLVELLGVIAILAVLATIATPAVISLSNKIKGNMYDAKVKLIKETAVLYAEKTGLTGKFLVNKLCYNTMINADDGLNFEDCLKNPVNNESMGTKCYFKITKKNGRYIVDFPVNSGGNPSTNSACLK